MLIEGDQISGLDASDDICRRVRDIFSQEWSCDQNILFHALDQNKAASVLQGELRSKANHLLKGGQYETSTAAGTVGISFTYNHHSNFSFRRSPATQEGGVLCFPLQSVLGEDTLLTTPKSGQDPFEILLLHEDNEAEEAVLKRVMSSFETSGPAVFGQGGTGYFEKIMHGRSLLNDAKKNALQLIQNPDAVRTKLQTQDVEVDITDNELTHLYQQNLTNLVEALDNPLGYLLCQPPKVLRKISKLYKRRNTSARLDVSDETLLLAKQELTRGLQDAGGSSYFLKINQLRGYIPASLVKKGRKHIEEGVTEQFDTLTLPEAIHLSVQEDNYNILWNTAFKYTLHSRNLKPLSNLSAKGCDELWQHTYEVIRRVSHEHLGSASLSVETRNCIALLQKGCSDALKQSVKEKDIPTVLYNPTKHSTEEQQNQYIFALFCQLLDKAGLDYDQTELQDKDYKKWLKNASILPTQVENSTVTAYERQPY